MRYYVSLRKTTGQDKNYLPVFKIPLWIWLPLIALCLLGVLALR